MPCGDKKLVWKSFQTNQLLSHCAVVSHSGSTELTHAVLELQRVIVCQSNSLPANHYELKYSKSSLKQKLAEDLLEIHQSSLRRKFHSTSTRQWIFALAGGEMGWDDVLDEFCHQKGWPYSPVFPLHHFLYCSSGCLVSHFRPHTIIPEERKRGQNTAPH